MRNLLLVVLLAGCTSTMTQPAGPNAPGIGAAMDALEIWSLEETYVETHLTADTVKRIV